MLIGIRLSDDSWLVVQDFTCTTERDPVVACENTVLRQANLSQKLSACEALRQQVLRQQFEPFFWFWDILSLNVMFDFFFRRRDDEKIQTRVYSG